LTLDKFDKIPVKRLSSSEESVVFVCRFGEKGLIYLSCDGFFVCNDRLRNYYLALSESLEIVDAYFNV